MDDETRKVRCWGNELGEFSVDALYRMAMRGEINHKAEFWSNLREQWFPLAALIFDYYPDRLDEMRAVGIKRVEVLGSGEPDCLSCAVLQGKVYSIEDAPALPPAGCECHPWCRCIFLAKK